MHHYIKRTLKPKRSSIIFDLKLWLFAVLQPFKVQRPIVTHLKDSIHIFLEPEAQSVLWLLMSLLVSQSTLKSLHKMT